jgi:hypothetical protein
MSTPPDWVECLAASFSLKQRQPVIHLFALFSSCAFHLQLRAKINVAKSTQCRLSSHSLWPWHPGLVAPLPTPLKSTCSSQHRCCGSSVDANPTGELLELPAGSVGHFAKSSD